MRDLQQSQEEELIIDLYQSQICQVNNTDLELKLLESRVSDEMPVLRYERNTKLDINLHPARHEESYQSAEIEQE